MTEQSSIYPEVVDFLGFEMAEDSEDEDDEEEDEDNGLGFALKNMIIPLGIGAKTWAFNSLGMVTNSLAASSGINIQPTDYTAKQTSLDRERHATRIFSLNFESKPLPFEFKLHPSGKVIVASGSETIDPRIQRGVTIFGINKTPLPISPNSLAFLEEMLQNIPVPFTVVFEALDHHQHSGNPYEEEEDDEEGQEHVGESTEDDDDDDEEESKENEHRVANMLRPSILKTMTTISDRVRAMVVRGGVETDTTHNNHTHNNTHHTDTSTSTSNTTQLHKKEDSSQNVSEVSDELDEDGTFPLVLSGRSPPFVYDLHADGRSIVLVKLLDSSGGKSVHHQCMQEGCVVRRINGKPFTCTSRAEFEQLLVTADTPIRLHLEAAPALYRHQDALRLYSGASSNSISAEPHLHVFTVLPAAIENKTRPKGGLFATDQGYEYDDVFVTSRRAMQVLQAFRAQGVAVTLVSMETVLVNASSSAYSGLMRAPGTACVRGIRVWFRFADAFELGPIDCPKKHLAALQVAKASSTGSWIVVRCIADSPWVDGGMVLGRPYLLTHVNGRDISASGYRSVQPRVKGEGDWDDSVLPLLTDSNKVRFTLV
eukprot:gene9500-19735_t